MTRKRLNDPVALAKVIEQSSGPLYDLFLAGNDGRIHRWHHYFDSYERHLSRYRGRPLRMLEIGVQYGGSIGMWAEYFGDQATLVGVDINPAVSVFDGMRPNINIRVGNQRDTAFLASLEAEFGPFDVIIDDGGHTALQQIETFNFLYPAMTEDGVYVCEDTHTSYWDGFKDGGTDVTFIQYTKKLIDVLHSPYHRENLFLSRYGTAPADREGALQTYRFAAETHAILIYDSMVFFERRPRAEPFHERR
ncbi:MAG: class I SAM-dependent methyltransferase [Thalassobaculaceae bacterium]|nr:class I SAM-dependent methyltransferase [Thalassobaculaceae bacterium]